MNNDGFLLFDSMFALLIFSALIMIVPGLIYIMNVDHLSQEQLEVYRELYIMSTNYDEPDDFIEAAKEILADRIKTCDERLKKLCS